MKTIFLFFIVLDYYYYYYLVFYHAEENYMSVTSIFMMTTKLDNRIVYLT